MQKYIIPKIPRNLLLNIWAGIASRACALRNFFPRKTFQPITISVISLYVNRLHSDGFGAQTRHKPVTPAAMPHGAGLVMQAYPNKRIGAHRKWCTPMFVWSRGVFKNAPTQLSLRRDINPYPVVFALESISIRGYFFLVKYWLNGILCEFQHAR